MDPSPAYVILDVGTTLLKTSWFSPDGRRIAGASRELQLHAPRPGVAEQTPASIWDAACLVLREAQALAKDAIPAALSITSERSTVFLADKGGKPLTPALTWMDQRTGKRAQGLKQRINGRIGLGKWDALRDLHPKAFDRAARVHVPHSFLVERLAGVAATDVVNALYLGAGSDRRYDEPLLSELGLDAARLPQVHAGQDVVGELTPAAAKATNLPPRTPVVCGSGDQQCGSLGLGVHRPGTAKATTGTGTFVNAPVDEPPFEFFDKDLKLFCTPRATGDGQLLEAVLPGTGSVYRWARDQLYPKGTTFAALDEEAAKVTPGSHGVQFMPLFPFSLGGFHRLGFHATRGHLLRSILEASAYGSRFFLEVMKELGLKVDGALRLDGGGARSPLWRRILADVHRRKVAWPKHVEDAAALGAAILCSLATKQQRDADKAIAAMVRLEPPLAPDPKAADLYEQEYGAWQSGFFTAAAGVDV